MINLVRSFILCVFLSSMPSVFCVPSGISVGADSIYIQCVVEEGRIPTDQNAFVWPKKIKKPYSVKITKTGSSSHISFSPSSSSTKSSSQESSSGSSI